MLGSSTSFESLARKGGWTTFFRDKNYQNQQCNDLGINNAQDLGDFLAPNGLHKRFRQVLLLEYFDEGLLLMKQDFNWELEDIMYIRLLESCGGYNWDGFKVQCPSGKADDLDDFTKRGIAQVNELDQRLYSFYESQLKATLAAQDPSFWEELAEFRALLKALSDFCANEQLERKEIRARIAREIVKLENQEREERKARGIRSNTPRYKNNNPACGKDDSVRQQQLGKVVDPPTPCYQYLISDTEYQELIRRGKGYASPVTPFPIYQMMDNSFQKQN